jgi:hypothetical protein
LATRQLPDDSNIRDKYPSNSFKTQEQQEAVKAFDAVLDEIIRTKDASIHQSTLLYLLNDYSYMEQYSKARKCFSMIDVDPINEFADFPCMAFAQYYDMCGKTDSAILYSNLVLEKGPTSTINTTRQSSYADYTINWAT